jgi:hypothetical protein
LIIKIRKILSLTSAAVIINQLRLLNLEHV